MDSRRSILKLIGVAPAAAVSTKGAVMAALNGPKMASNMSLGQLAGGSVASSAQHPQHVYDLHRRLQQEQSERAQMRLAGGGIDPDIASMRSLSGSFKRLKQLDRNIEDFSMMDKFQKFLWGQG